MQFAHILRKEKDEMVQVNATRFATKERNLLCSRQSWIRRILVTALAKGDKQF